MSKEFDIHNPGFSQFSYKFLTKNLQISRRKLREILNFLRNKPENTRRFDITLNGNDIDIYCPKLKDLCDEFTQKQLAKLSGVNRDKVRKPLIKEVELELEKDGKENIKRKSLLSLFEKIEHKFTPEQLRHKQKFLECWTEKSDGGKNERWEKQDTFNVNLRFHTWLRNAKEWGKDKNKSQLDKNLETLDNLFPYENGLDPDMEVNL